MEILTGIEQASTSLDAFAVAMSTLTPLPQYGPQFGEYGLGIAGFRCPTISGMVALGCLGVGA